jgi:hypothetical protein
VRPSSAHRWAYCALSLSFTGDGDDESGEAAKEGTLAHDWAAKVLTGTAQLADIPDDEMRAGVKLYVDTVRSRLREGLQLKVEEYLTMASIHPDLGGTTDAYLLDHINRILYVYDFKYGYRPVRAHGNWQGVCYATGVIEKYNLGKDWTVVFTIVQPRDWLRSVKEWRTTVPEIQHLASVLSRAAARVGTNEAATGEHCRYCPGRHSCEALRVAAAAAIDVSMQEDPVTLDDVALGMELDRLWIAQERLGFRVQSLEMQALHRITEGRRVYGLCLKPGQSREVWTAPDNDLFTAADLLGVDIRSKPKPLTPRQARQAGLPDVVAKAFSARTPTLKLERSSANE